MRSIFSKFQPIFVSILLLSPSVVFAGAIEDFKHDYCVYGTGTATSTYALEVDLLSPSGFYQDCTGVSVAISNGDSSTEIVNAIALAIGVNCGWNGRVETGTLVPPLDACATTDPASIGFRIITLMSDFQLKLEPVAGLPLVAVTPSNPVEFNPVVYVPEPSGTLLLSAGVFGLLGFARRRRG